MATNFSLRPFSSRSSSFHRKSRNPTSPNPSFLFPSKQTYRIRISSSIKGKGEVSDKERGKVPAGLSTNRDLQLENSEDNPPALSKENESTGSYQAFEWKWPPWKHLQQRYKVIGTTSLAFVICNMDKVMLVIFYAFLEMFRDPFSTISQV